MTRPLQVGIQLPEVEREVRWPEYAAMARAAEEAGFDSVWLGDHLLYRDDGRPERGPWEAWTMLAGIAAITRRIRIGPLVACAGFHEPAMLAKLAATVDEISGGRLVFGIGAGWNRPDFDAFGFPYDNRVGRFTESFEIVRRLLAGERVSFEGRFHRVGDAVLLPAPARTVPLMVGSDGPRVLAATLPHVAAWNTWYDLYGNTPEGFARSSARVDEAARAAGRDPGEIARSACVLVAIEGAANPRPHDHDIAPVMGSPADIAGSLRDFAAAGADEAILVVNPITEGSIRGFAATLAELDR